MKDQPSPENILAVASPLETRLLQFSDIPGALRLKEAAGWNQLARDWERILELQPDGCFGLQCDGDLAASGTALAYGQDLVWIGMILTDPRFRGRGFARLIMERCMQFSEKSGAPYVGLDATDMGIGLYRRFGFVEAGYVERWYRGPSCDLVEPVDVDPFQPAPELDIPAFGTDRTFLLNSLSTCGAASLGTRAFAMGRGGSKAAYFGPCVAKSTADAETLLCWFLSSRPGEAAYWDILTDNLEAAQLAEKYGFQRVRRLTRMYHCLKPGVAPPQVDNSAVFAIAGFELG